MPYACPAILLRLDELGHAYLEDEDLSYRLRETIASVFSQFVFIGVNTKGAAGLADSWETIKQQFTLSKDSSPSTSTDDTMFLCVMTIDKSVIP